MVMKDSNIVIFQPSGIDIAKLSALGRKLFVQTFDGLYSQEDLEFFLNNTFSSAGLLRDLESGCDYWAAKDLALPDSPWIGYCKAGPVKVPIASEPELHEADLKLHNGRSSSRSLELRQLYIDHPYQRRGLGAKFMEKFLQLCQQRDIEIAYVSCWSENLKALKFYQRFGFEIIGQYEFPVGNHRDIEFILRRCFVTQG
jgi:diamine N-acetyltransferase